MPSHPLSPDPAAETALRDGLWLDDGSFVTPEALLELLDVMRKLEAERAPLRYQRLPAGRPSLTGKGVVSPRISFRVPAEMHKRAKLLARWEDKTVSQYAREAFERQMWAPSLGPLRNRWR